MAAKGVNGIAVGAIGVGGLLVYSGLTGRGVLASIQALVQGQPLTIGAAIHPIVPADPGVGTVQDHSSETPGSPGGTGSAVITGGGSATGDAIASTALSYDKAGYVWAGAPARGVGNWDCSSFVNWVVGHVHGLAIPTYKAGSYDGSAHGPTALMWYAWTGAKTISGHGADAQPGDLCVWQTHIGIAIGGGRMISARSASDNPPTGINTIDGDIPGEILAVRRLKVLI